MLNPLGINPVARLQALVGAMAADVRSMAQAVSVLPDVALTLETIRARVENLDAEVTQMRRAVQEIQLEVGGLREGVEPHMADLSRAVRPFKRVSGRLSRGGRAPEPRLEDPPA
jgi:hypothetical protein